MKPEAVEHFGITIIEAINADCVPLVFDAGGPSEIVSKSKTGLTYRSVDEAAALLVQLINPDSRDRLIKAADRSWLASTTETAFDERLQALVA